MAEQHKIMRFRLRFERSKSPRVTSTKPFIMELKKPSGTFCENNFCGMIDKKLIKPTLFKKSIKTKKIAI